MKIFYLRRAENSLEEILDFIAKGNPKAAYMELVKIRRSCELLTEKPNLGKIGRVKGTRELIIDKGKYIVPYRVKGNRIEILHIFHTKREPSGFN